MSKIIYPQLNRFIKENKGQIDKINKKIGIVLILMIILTVIPLYKYPYLEYKSTFTPMFFLFASELGAFSIFISKDELCIVLSLLYNFYFISFIVSSYFFLNSKKLILSKKIKNYKKCIFVMNPISWTRKMVLSI